MLRITKEELKYKRFKKDTKDKVVLKKYVSSIQKKFNTK